MPHRARPPQHQPGDHCRLANLWEEATTPLGSMIIFSSEKPGCHGPGSTRKQTSAPRSNGYATQLDGRPQRRSRQPSAPRTRPRRPDYKPPSNETAPSPRTTSGCAANWPKRWGNDVRPRHPAKPPTRDPIASVKVALRQRLAPVTRRSTRPGGHVEDTQRHCPRRVRPGHCQDNHGYAAGLHRGLPTSVTKPAKEFSARHDGQVRAAIQPISTGFELAALLRGFTPLVPHVHLLVSLAEPAPSGSTGASRRCRGCLPPSPASPGSGCPQLHRPAATGRRWRSLTPTRFMAPRGARWRKGEDLDVLVTLAHGQEPQKREGVRHSEIGQAQQHDRS
jgi:hypothetical protein